MNFSKQQEVSIQAIISEVKKQLAEAEGGHDWWHILRVWKNAQLICKKEEVDRYVVELAALLHDIADAKFHDGNEDIGPERALRILETYKVGNNTIEHVISIIKNMSFKNSFERRGFDSPEMRVLQDADRLDAIGAIGIARTFSYGGYKGHPFMDPNIAPINHDSKASYKQSTAPTINHFYEKLLLLKEGMHTQTAKVMAEERHDYMLGFLNQFYKEWGDRPEWG
ncbi:MAG: hypothetical protein ACI9FN_002540 [Saprospiraceae bacterium]|jgi:uncharacterized protein